MTSFNKGQRNHDDHEVMSLVNKRSANETNDTRYNSRITITSSYNTSRSRQYCLGGIFLLGITVTSFLVLYQQFSSRMTTLSYDAEKRWKQQTSLSDDRLEQQNTVEDGQYHPDLTFVLSPEQNNKRLDFIHSKSRPNDVNINSNNANPWGTQEVPEVEGDDNVEQIDQSADVKVQVRSTATSYPDLTFTLNSADLPSQDTTASKLDIPSTNDNFNSSNDTQLCRRDEVVHGKWVHSVTKKPPYITPTVHLRCYHRDRYYDTDNGWSTWKWQPDNKDAGTCTFVPFFDSKKFCQLMDHAVISIVGDSLSWEHYSSLVQLNGIRTHQTFQHQSHELLTNIYQPVCNGRTKVVYRYDDRLQNLTASLKDNFPVVLVLNRGAHFKPDEELLPDIRNNIDEIKKYWIPKCVSLQIKCHLFWRTSVPGHPGCYKAISHHQKKIKKKEVAEEKPRSFEMAYTEPVNDLQHMENLIANLSMYNNRSINYHWYDYQRQNQLVVTEFQKAFQDDSHYRNNPYFHFEIMDAYYLNVLRPDEHRAHQVRKKHGNQSSCCSATLCVIQYLPLLWIEHITIFVWLTILAYAFTFIFNITGRLSAQLLSREDGSIQHSITTLFVRCTI
jgi:hypothetical protein